MGRDPGNVKYPEDQTVIDDMRRSFLTTMLTSSGIAGVATHLIGLKVLPRRLVGLGTVGKGSQRPSSSVFTPNRWMLPWLEHWWTVLTC